MYKSAMSGDFCGIKQTSVQKVGKELGATCRMVEAANEVVPWDCQRLAIHELCSGVTQVLFRHVLIHRSTHGRSLSPAWTCQTGRLARQPSNDGEST